ncbi:hypothetical protein L6Q96_21910 [Candidatus Binatia bacterium]|nr:hypothetical protein [Candidatus Binatia bacterium]
MHTVIGWLDILFGRGSDDHPFWLLTVRIDILLFVLCSAATIVWTCAAMRSRDRRPAGVEVWTILALSVLAGALRFAVEHNLTALGGIGYSRILHGYRGHFATAQLYSLVYPWAGRSLETAILLNRFASTLTVPLVYALCRCLVPAQRAFAVAAALLIALQPLHLLFTATDGLPVSTSLLAVWSYLLLWIGIGKTAAPAWVRTLAAGGAALGTALLTQVRYENFVFVVPPLVYLAAERRRVNAYPLVPAALLFAVFVCVYLLAAFGSNRAFQSVVPISEGLRAAVFELVANPVFALGPLAVATGAAVALGRGTLRWLALLPAPIFLIVVALAIGLERHDYGAGFVPLARLHANLLLLPTLAAAYGVALLWESRRHARRALALGCLVWTAALTALYWPNLRQRYLEIAEHDFLRESLVALPPEVSRVVVPDDEILFRESHSTIELLAKYRAVAAAAGTTEIEIVGLTSFLEQPDAVDCGHGHCAFFMGLPCTGGRYYWFAETQCTQLMTALAGPPLRETEVLAGTFLDCSLLRGATRPGECTGAVPRRFGMYRIVR